LNDLCGDERQQVAGVTETPLAGARGHGPIEPC